MVGRFAIVVLASLLQLPPVSWTCPMHPEIVEDAKGLCPICRMPLEAVRLEQVWSCPIHSVVAEKAGGRCRICGRDLVPITMAMTWTCADRAGVAHAEPVACADGSSPILKYTPRPHGNHNPQHGGAFFMAPDNWHHVEGAYPRAGVFRLYLYDDYSRPLSADRLRRAAARVEAPREVPLVARSGGFLEARVPVASLPAQMTAKVRFKPGEPEHRFDFAFTDYTKDTKDTKDTTDTKEVGASEGQTRDVDSTRTPRDQLKDLARQIADAIARRAFGEIWVPALQAKDVALAIETATTDRRRDAVSAAVRELVRAAWMLDTYGDLGNAQQIADAHARFVGAMKQLDAALR